MTPVHLNNQFIFYSIVRNRTVNDFIEFEGKCYRVIRREIAEAGEVLHVSIIGHNV